MIQSSILTGIIGNILKLENGPRTLEEEQKFESFEGRALMMPFGINRPPLMPPLPRFPPMPIPRFPPMPMPPRPVMIPPPLPYLHLPRPPPIFRRNPIPF